MNYFKIERIAGRTVYAGERIVEIDDAAALKKAADGVYHYLAEDRFGRVVLVDRPESPSKFEAVEKRDSRRSFAEAYNRLIPQRTGASNPGYLGRIAKSARLDGMGGLDHDERAEKLRMAAGVAVIHAGTAARNVRNARLKRVIAKCAQQNYANEQEARRAFNKALRAEFSATERDQMGLL